MMTTDLVLAQSSCGTQHYRQAIARPWPTAQRATKAPCLGAALLMAAGGWIGIGSMLLLVV